MCCFSISEVDNDSLKRKAMEECDSAFTVRVVNRKNYEVLFNKIAHNALFIVAETRDRDGSSIAGYAALYANDFSSFEAYITLICVKKGKQRSGIGSALMNHCLKKARERGMHSIRLEVLKEDTGAIAFYERYGFKVQKENFGSYYMVRKL